VLQVEEPAAVSPRLSVQQLQRTFHCARVQGTQSQEASAGRAAGRAGVSERVDILTIIISDVAKADMDRAFEQWAGPLMDCFWWPTSEGKWTLFSKKKGTDMQDRPKYDDEVRSGTGTLGGTAYQQATRAAGANAAIRPPEPMPDLVVEAAELASTIDSMRRSYNTIAAALDRLIGRDDAPEKVSEMNIPEPSTFRERLHAIGMDAATLASRYNTIASRIDRAI
jgi:hypothetical protein